MNNDEEYEEEESQDDLFYSRLIFTQVLSVLFCQAKGFF